MAFCCCCLHRLLVPALDSGMKGQEERVSGKEGEGKGLVSQRPVNVSTGDTRGDADDARQPDWTRDRQGNRITDPAFPSLKERRNISCDSCSRFRS